MLDLVAGTVPLGTMTWGSAIGQIRAGTVRPVAISSEKRAAEFPDVPTLQELGYGLVANSWFGLSGPPGLPAVIVTRLNRGAIEVLSAARGANEVRCGRNYLAADDAGRIFRAGGSRHCQVAARGEAARTGTLTCPSRRAVTRRRLLPRWNSALSPSICAR